MSLLGSIITAPIYLVGSAIQLAGAVVSEVPGLGWVEDVTFDAVERVGGGAVDTIKAADDFAVNSAREFAESVKRGSP